MTQGKVNGWMMRWYDAEAVVGRDYREKDAEALAKALAVAPWPDARSVTVEPATGGGARVLLRMKARHAGDACAKAVDFIREHAPREWDWASASVSAARMPEGIRRWPLLRVDPVSGEAAAEHVARVLAGDAAERGASAAELTKILQAVGLMTTPDVPSRVTASGSNRPSPPGRVKITFRKPASDCCGAPPRKGGTGIDPYPVCTQCELPCEVREAG